MTNADVPTLATQGVIEGATNPFTGVAITMDEKTAHDQIDTINRSLPIYKRIRRVVVRKDPFPRTASGKIKV